MARCIYDIDVYALVLHRTIFCQDGNATLFFKIVAIHHTFSDVLMGGKCGRLRQQLIHHGGLTMVNVSNDGDITDCARHMYYLTILRARILTQ